MPEPLKVLQGANSKIMEGKVVIAGGSKVALRFFPGAKVDQSTKMSKEHSISAMQTE